MMQLTLAEPFQAELLHMTLFSQLDAGYYDDTGHWQRTKFCFIDCGTRCTCKAPGNLLYSTAHDKRLLPPAKSSSDEAGGA